MHMSFEFQAIYFYSDKTQLKSTAKQKNFKKEHKLADEQYPSNKRPSHLRKYIFNL